VALLTEPVADFFFSVGLAWEEVQQIKAVQFPHAPLFWSSLCWELYREHGRDGVGSTLAWLGKQAAAGRAKDWYGYLDDSN
jgi:hypothetical protein